MLVSVRLRGRNLKTIWWYVPHADVFYSSLCHGPALFCDPQLSRYPALKKFEQTVPIPKAYAALGAFGIFTLVSSSLRIAERSLDSRLGQREDCGLLSVERAQPCQCGPESRKSVADRKATHLRLTLSQPKEVGATAPFRASFVHIAHSFAQMADSSCFDPCQLWSRRYRFCSQQFVFFNM